MSVCIISLRLSPTSANLTHHQEAPRPKVGECKDRGSLVYPCQVELLHGAVIAAQEVLAPTDLHAGVTRQQQRPAKCSFASHQQELLKVHLQAFAICMQPQHMHLYLSADRHACLQWD